MSGSKLPASFDARDWAKEFVEICEKNPSIPLDIETMTTWFANAIMCGWDKQKKVAEEEWSRNNNHGL